MCGIADCDSFKSSSRAVNATKPRLAVASKRPGPAVGSFGLRPDAHHSLSSSAIAFTSEMNRRRTLGSVTRMKAFVSCTPSDVDRKSAI
jgi:hypothetical protein